MTDCLLGLLNYSCHAELDSASHHI